MYSTLTILEWLALKMKPATMMTITDADDDVEDVVSPTAAASVNKFSRLTTTLGSTITSTILPTFPHRRILVLPLDSISIPNHQPRSGIDHSTHHSFITNTPQALRTLPRRIRTLISPP